MKYKDPGCPTISVNIGGTYVEKVLLDLGANVNLLPYLVYIHLGLGELKPTTITLSLEYRSVKNSQGHCSRCFSAGGQILLPRGLCCPQYRACSCGANYVPIILGRPFLATSNAIIDELKSHLFSIHFSD